jgi:hypothetical protein
VPKAIYGRPDARTPARRRCRCHAGTRSAAPVTPSFGCPSAGSKPLPTTVLTGHALRRALEGGLAIVCDADVGACARDRRVPGM